MGPVRSKPEPHHWRHAAETVPLVILGLYTVVAVAGVFHLPWWSVPGPALAVSVAGTAAVASVAESGVAVSFTVIAGLVATGWSLYAMLAGPWTVTAAFSLVIPGLILGVLYPVVLGHHSRRVEEFRRAAEAERRAAEARKWPDLLARVGAKGVTVAGSEETRAGHTHLLRLPPTGKVTFARLEKLTDALETAARLRDGAIRFERGEHAGEVLMHVSEKDILAQVVPYPDDLSDLTVNEPFRVGLHEDGTVCSILFREICILVVGLRGSGKSNLINVLIAQLGRCVDTVIFMIDVGKSGRAALPWIKPWLDGKTSRPVIDWVATTRDEAERILDALLRGVEARAHSGAGGEKITPSAAQPAVALIIDEMAVIFGAHGGPGTFGQGTTNSRLAAKGTQIVELSRSEAIDAILATQRGTVTMTGGGDLKSQCGCRIGLGVASEADARTIIPDNASVAKLLPKLKHRGSGIVSEGDDRVKPAKFDRIEPGDVYGIAGELGDRRPEPDPVLAEALGDDYARRWTTERAGHIPGFTRAAVRTHGGGGDLGLGSGEFDRRFEDITSHLDDLDVADDGGEKSDHPAHARMLKLISDAGVMGMTPLRLGKVLDAEGLGVARGTIQRWLAEDLDAGRVAKASHGRWKAPRHG